MQPAVTSAIRSIALIVLFAMGSGCRGPDPAPQTEPTFTEVDKVNLMEQHYESAITAHDMVIQGNLPSFREHLAEVAAQSLPARAPADWRAPHRTMQEAAGGAATADDLASAAIVMGAVVGACGSCHEALGQGPVYRKPSPPKSEDPLKEQMLAHQWATERLWEGITGPWNEAWRRGVEAVAKSSVFPTGSDPALIEFENALRRVGEEASLSTGLSARSAAYGKLLATCAACHTNRP